jgi:hypothetical protein
MPSNTTESKGKSKAKTSNPKYREASKPKTTLTDQLASTGIVPDERKLMIEEAAYYRAQRRGFDPADQLSDWLEAEVEVDKLLRKIQNRSID